MGEFNTVVGLDGCQRAWVSASIEKGYFVFKRIAFGLWKHKYDVCVVDMPVKLATEIDNYPRLDDVYAKQILKKRHASIFYAPCDYWLEMTYEEINSQCSLNEKPKLSKQSFNLFAHIADVQFKHSMNNVFIESHPELFFNQRFSVAYSKKCSEGIDQRYKSLQSFFSKYDLEFPCMDFFYDHKQLLKCHLDDIFDACSMLAVGLLYKQGKAKMCGDILY